LTLHDPVESYPDSGQPELYRCVDCETYRDAPQIQWVDR